MPPLTVAEIIQHPEFKNPRNVTWDLPPTKKGKLDVAKRRGGPFKIAYEVHGHGPICLVWIIGLGALKVAWQRQIVDFAHNPEHPENASKYSSLIFDNRGMGESDKPLMRYSTSEMAKDVIELVDSLGPTWGRERGLHVIGVSMGGMIAQEMALLIPDRIASLFLMSTAARLVNTVGFLDNLRDRASLFIPKPLNTQVSEVKTRLFPTRFLSAPDADAGWASKGYKTPGFPTNGDRFAAQEISKRQDTAAFTRKGFMLQAIAAGWHHKSPEQVKELGDKVGRSRILVVHGSEDRMITVWHGDVLAKELSGGDDGVLGGSSGIGAGKVRYERVEGSGHVLMMEERKWFGKLVEEFVQRTEGMRK